MKTKINYQGKKIDIHYPDELEEDIKAQKEEIIRREIYKKGIKENGTYIDLGANVGMATRYFYPHAKKIYSIEPNPDIYKCLVKNVGELPNVKTFNFAMTYFDGNDYLYSNKATDIPQSLYGNLQATHSVEVKAKNFKTFFEENAITHVDTLKIDIEGAEFVVFPSDGFAAVADKIDLIIGESHNIPSASPDFVPIILKEYGFKTEFIKLKDPNYSKTMTFIDHYQNMRKEYQLPMHTMFIAKR